MVRAETREIEASAKNYRREAEGAEKGERSNTECTEENRRTQRRTAANSTARTSARGRLGELMQNSVAGFGGWRRRDAGGDECRVEGHYGDDDVGDHDWFGVDEDAVG